MHGFIAIAIAFMIKGHLKMAVVAMTLAVNFKQTAFHFVLPFGVFALAQIVQKSQRGGLFAIQTLERIAFRVILLLVVFIGTNLLIWSPWLFERDAKSGRIDLRKFNYDPAL